MPADLDIPLSIVNRQKEQDAVLFALLRSDTPPARKCETVIENILAAGRFDRNDGKFDVSCRLKPLQYRLEFLSVRLVNDVRIIYDISKRHRRRNWRGRILATGQLARERQQHQTKDCD